MKIITDKTIQRIRYLRYNEKSFAKSADKNHPEYEVYKDRQLEEAHDRGYNNAINDVLRMLK